MASKPLEVVRFWSEPRPGKTSVDMVELASPTAISPQGVRTHSTNHRVKDLKPRDDMGNLTNEHMALIQARWDIISPAYEAWKAGQEMPLVGTPLAAWSTLSAQQVEALRQAGFKSIEQVAEASEGHLMAIRLPNSAIFRETARQWIKSQDSAAKEQRIADLEAKIAAMSDMMAEQAARAAAEVEADDDQEDEPTPKKRGRPKKAADPEDKASADINAALFGED